VLEWCRVDEAAPAAAPRIQRARRFLELKRHLICVLVTASLIGLAVCAWADGPLLPATGKLFGAVLPESAPASHIQVYEKSGATASFIRAEWGKIEKTNPGDGQSRYDFSTFDTQPLIGSNKTRVLIFDMTNSWAGEVKSADRLRSLAAAFLNELTRHAHSKGIRHFWLAPEAHTGGDHSPATYVRDLKALYGSAKAAGKDSLVLAGLYKSPAEAVEQFYNAGAMGSFDVLAVDVSSEDPRFGIDMLKLLRVREVMLRNGDGARQLLVVGTVDDQADKRVQNTYRSILTRRDMTDPGWILGAVAIGKPGMMPSKPFPPEIPANTLDCSIAADGPVLNYVAGKPYKLTLTFNNSAEKQIKIGKFAVDFPDAKDLAIEIKPGEMPNSADPRSAAAAEFTINFPTQAAGRPILIRGAVDYSLDGNDYYADCYFPAMVTSELELTLLPQKVIFGVSPEPQTVGMSLINHLGTLYSGDVLLKPYKGIKTSVAQRKMVVDPYGLDAFVFKVEKEPATKPGHYAIVVEVGDKVKDWIAVDVALQVKKASGKVDINGDLSEWADVESLRITTRSKDGQTKHVGSARFAYDDAALYGAFEIEDAKHISAVAQETQHDSIQIAIDPLMNGSHGSEGGFRNDDYLFALRGSDSNPVVVRIDGLPVSAAHVQAPLLAFRHEGGKSYYEVAFPWSAIAPLDAKSAKTFGLSVLVNMTDGETVEYAEWGGGMLPKVDPRAFMPAVLVQ
jgi:hypothetical protein